MTGKESFGELAQIQYEFACDYREMLRVVRTLHKPTLVCTIYDSIPGLECEAVTALYRFSMMSSCAAPPSNLVCRFWI